LARRFTEVKKAHHFYPVLFYFRFPEPFYLVSGSALDTASLLKTALDPRPICSPQNSAALEHLRRARLMVMRTLERVFVLHHGAAGRCETPDAETLRRWRQRYFAALRELQNAEIPIIDDAKDWHRAVHDSARRSGPQ
jgi:hypothetical protein